MFKWLAALAMAVVCAAPVRAADQAAMDRLSSALQLEAIVEIMRREGLESSADLANEMLGGGGPEWLAALDRIYDKTRMLATVEEGMSATLDNEEAQRIAAFYSTDLGAEIIALELSARAAFMDESIEEASNEVALALPETDPDRFALVEEYIEVNNLIESNVVGGLNSNYAFFTGLADGGFFDGALTEDEMLAEIWAQEGEIRTETTMWLHSYAGLAYRPLTDEEMQIYIDFSRTDAGQAMNRALFAGFDQMFVDISRALGLTLGRMGGAEEL